MVTGEDRVFLCSSEAVHVHVFKYKNYKKTKTNKKNIYSYKMGGKKTNFPSFWCYKLVDHKPSITSLHFVSQKSVWLS